MGRYGGYRGGCYEGGRSGGYDGCRYGGCRSIAYSSSSGRGCSGGCYSSSHSVSSRSSGQHKTAACSYRSTYSHSPSDKTAATWGARGAAAAYGKTDTKAAAASGAYRTTLAHGGTKDQAKAAARGAVAGLSGKGKHTYTPHGGCLSCLPYSRAVSNFTRMTNSLQRQYEKNVKSHLNYQQVNYTYDEPASLPPQPELIKIEKIIAKIQECNDRLDELRVIAPKLHGRQLLGARRTETKLFTLIDELDALLRKLNGVDSISSDTIESPSGIEYHSIEPESKINDGCKVSSRNDDGPTIEYHQLGA